VAFVICLAVLGLVSSRRRLRGRVRRHSSVPSGTRLSLDVMEQRGSSAHADSGDQTCKVALTLVPWHRALSEPADPFDWLGGNGSFNSQDQGSFKSQDQEDEKSKPGSSRLKQHERSLSDGHADFTMFYRIDSKLTEEDSEFPQQPEQQSREQSRQHLLQQRQQQQQQLQEYSPSAPLKHVQQQLQQLRRLQKMQQLRRVATL